MITTQEIAIEEFHTRLSISRIDLWLLLFLSQGGNEKEFQTSNNFSEEQIDKSLERLVYGGFTYGNILTIKGKDIVKRIKQRIQEIEVVN